MWDIHIYNNYKLDIYAVRPNVWGLFGVKLYDFSLFNRVKMLIKQKVLDYDASCNNVTYSGSVRGAGSF